MIALALLFAHGCRQKRAAVPPAAPGEPDLGPLLVPDLSPIEARCGDGQCTLGRETCESCPDDCGRCDGCQPRTSPDCPGCACAPCVCAVAPHCCIDGWDAICARWCRDRCGGCGAGDAGPRPVPDLSPFPRSPDLGPHVPAHCGDRRCDRRLESCDTCPVDCGLCDGCLATEAAGCPGCRCEACVVKADAYCARVTWDLTCVDACKKGCGGCGRIPGSLAAHTPLVPLPITPHNLPPDAGVKVRCGDKTCHRSETCDTCPDDCGRCDGTRRREGFDCPNCACRDCVCTDDTYCCLFQWDDHCARQCATRCRL